MSTIPLSEIQQVLDEADLIYSAPEVNQAISNLANQINQQLANQYPLCLTVMLGGMIFSGQLLPQLNFLLEADYIHATRYRGATQGGEVLHWLKTPERSLKDRIILLIDDVLDEGATLSALVDYCQQAGAKRVLTAVLIDKKRQRQGLQKADFAALTSPDRYIFGYGMDYKEQLRNAAGIYAVKGL
ncbi:hypoxanthine-guanine phosphoribosyltransferase [Beggiatoa alba B18LD]|uniref:Hypoxanthine-guanine phosphoribosyltransferase n=1 Tax=Beggiatoa alba B18LD TaxID=395493 RepID=I3CEV3_9GAMM|nr:hypoxanthine-guanine phosphoribosyltransferase [Beggiatoa alba]EIJ42146.1 hypoxanthine-guanine phosphoribosyltransferase [Beggiatoa alba B18LD]